jgi:hypothetical protein
VRPLLSVVLLPPSDCLQEWRGMTLLGTRDISHANCKQHITVPSSARQRKWESRPPKSLSAEIHLHGCAGDQILGSVFMTARVIHSTQRFVYILFFVVFPGDVCCYSSFGNRSRDYMAYIFLHQFCTTTSNIHTRYLM